MSKVDMMGIRMPSNKDKRTAIAVANMAEAQKRMYKKFDNSHFLKRLTQIGDFHEAKAKSIHFRRNLLTRQKVANYNNELDRISGVLGLTVLNGVTKAHLERRRGELEDMKKRIN